MCYRACFSSPSRAVSCEHLQCRSVRGSAPIHPTCPTSIPKPSSSGFSQRFRQRRQVPQYAIDADTLRALLLLLYGAGLRRGEAMRLKIEDVDISQSLIHIRGTKFFKTRIVPLSDDLNTVIRTFIARQRNHYSVGGESRLFSSCDDTALSETTVGVTFRRLCTIAGIRRNGGARNQPRIHDLRHSAAVHRVTAWYRCDADLNDLLPKLATYLGHAGLSGTQRYLTMTQELLAEASCRFEAFARGHRHD